MSKGIVLFSGGRDSTLAAYLAAQRTPETRWDLVTYDNHNLVGGNKLGGPEQIWKELSDSVANISGHETIPFFHLFRSLVVLRSELNVQQYGFSTMCLDCRGAMYVKSVLLADEREYTKLVDGARESQRYTEQLPGSIKEFTGFLNNNGIEMIIPVYDINKREEVSEQLKNAGFSGKNYELQCLWKKNMAKLPDEDLIKRYVGEELVPLMYETVDLLRKKGTNPELENLVISNNIRRREKGIHV